jgi:hypothetical protein
MAGGIALPVAVGFVVGIGVIVIFGISSVPITNDARTVNDIFADYPYRDLPERVWMGRDSTGGYPAPMWYTVDGKHQDMAAATTDYLESNGITVYEVKRLENTHFDGEKITSPGWGGCEAIYGCPDYGTIFVLVHKSNVNEMIEIDYQIYYGNFMVTNGTRY